MQVPRFSPRILYIASKSSGRVSALAALPLPCPALFVTTNRQNHLIGPKIRVVLLEDNGLEMQA
jgi:hypothetical protein